MQHGLLKQETGNLQPPVLGNANMEFFINGEQKLNLVPVQCKDIFFLKRFVRGEINSKIAGYPATPNFWYCTVPGFQFSWLNSKITTGTYPVHPYKRYYDSQTGLFFIQIQIPFLKTRTYVYR